MGDRTVKDDLFEQWIALNSQTVGLGNKLLEMLTREHEERDTINIIVCLPCIVVSHISKSDLKEF